MSLAAIRDFDVFLFRAPAQPPVQTSFGIMRDRPAVLVKLTDEDGVSGWGEIFCNFPTVGAEHRARLALACLKPIVLSQAWESPASCWATLTEKLAVLVLQTGESGPIAQAICGVEQALWDLAARHAGLPLWRMLGGRSAPTVAVYASGINPTEPDRLAKQKLAEGYRAFKLKVGFGTDRDEANLQAMRGAIGSDNVLMVDANQAWNLEQALQAGERMARHDLLWLEEPLRADAPLEDWKRLAANQPLRLAGGENLAGLAAFSAHLKAGVFGVIQPDIGKWGGLSGALAVAQLAHARGQWMCPHWLGGGVGLMGSLHLKAAAGGEGYVEVDANPNPLRDLLAGPAFKVTEGSVTLSELPGLGFEPDIAACEAYRLPIPATGL